MAGSYTSDIGHYGMLAMDGRRQIVRLVRTTLLPCLVIYRRITRSIERTDCCVATEYGVEGFITQA